MARNEDGSRNDQDRDWEVERYRRAAEDALQQLDWCIGYLHGIRKVQVSRALSKNRSYIRKELLNLGEISDPTLQKGTT